MNTQPTSDATPSATTPPHKPDPSGPDTAASPERPRKGAATYTVFRKIHLYASLIIAAFLLMYFVTGYVMIHTGWFPHRESGPAVVTSTHPVTSAGNAASPGSEAFAAYLQDALGFGGKFTGQEKTSDGWKFTWFRPGVNIEAVVSEAGDAVTLTETHQDFRGLVNGYHRMHQYDGPLLYDLWTLLYDVASLSLIVFAITGVYLWWKFSKRKIWGVLCLIASWGFAAATIAYIMLAR